VQQTNKNNDFYSTIHSLLIGEIEISHSVTAQSFCVARHTQTHYWPMLVMCVMRVEALTYIHYITFTTWNLMAHRERN